MALITVPLQNYSQSASTLGESQQINVHFQIIGSTTCHIHMCYATYVMFHYVLRSQDAKVWNSKRKRKTGARHYKNDCNKTFNDF